MIGLRTLEWLVAAALLAAAGSAAAQIQMLVDSTDPDLASEVGKAPNIDGIDSVADAAAEAGKIPGKRVLIIAGHGLSGMIGMGSGKSPNYIRGKDLSYAHLSDVSSELAHIAATFAPAPAGQPNLLILCGCSVGAGPNGLSLLTQLSNQFPNTIVVAPTVMTEVGPWVKGKICAYVAPQANGIQWRTGWTVAARNGNPVPVDDALISQINSAACIPCTSARRCQPPTGSERRAAAAAAAAGCADVARSAPARRRRG
ncbi:MAG TPA: hypothetical protein VF759_04585 [Allosphingosinicella sp.]|jgi:hypothetical protein